MGNTRPCYVEESCDYGLDEMIVTTVKLPVWLREWLLEVAITKKCTVSDIIRRAIVYYLESLEVNGVGKEQEKLR